MSHNLWASVGRPAPGKVARIKKFSVGETFLDVGCAQGWYAQIAQQMGMKVLGTDLKNFMVVDDVPFEQISAGELVKGTDRKFDTVVMFDVLEHIQDEDAALAQLQQISNKRVILSVPNADDKNLPDYNVTLVNRKDLTHQRYYSPEYLTNKLSEYGFEIIDISYDGAVLPGIVGEYIRPRFLGKFITKLLNGLLFKGILKSPYFGDVYAVAEKRP